MLKFDGRTEATSGQFVSGDYHRGLGIAAIHGRVLLADDDRPDAAPVAVISRRLWQRMFAGDPAALGKIIWMNYVPVTIVGVVSGEGVDPIEAGYRGREITLPLSTMRQIELELGARLSASSAWWLNIMARLRPGVPPARRWRASKEFSNKPHATGSSAPKIRSISVRFRGLAGCWNFAGKMRSSGSRECFVENGMKRK